MDKIKMLIDEFYKKYNIYPNKLIIGLDIYSHIIMDVLETMGAHVIHQDDKVKLFGIDTEIDFRHENRVSVMLELMEEINE